MSYVLGIDVGAARTSAAVARPGSDSVEPVDLGDGGCGVASVLHLGADGSLDVGEAAERWADGEPERMVRGFPGRIGDDVPMLLAGEPWAPEELTAWLVRWVVDRVAECEGGSAAGIAVTRPATWDDDRIELLAGALAEQDLDVTFLTTARAAEWHTPAADDAAPVASAAACGAALALLAGDVEAERTDDIAVHMAAAAQFPGMPAARTGGAPDDARSADIPAPRTHDSGDRPADDTPPAAHADEGERRVEGSGAHEASVEGSGSHAVGDGRIRGQNGSAEASGAHAAPNRTEADPVVDRAGAADALLAALGGFTGTLGATNTAGLLSGYTPPSGLALSATGSGATALIVETDEPLAPPAQRNGSGRRVALSDDEEADEREPVAAPAPVAERVRSPAALVSIGGAAAAVAVVSTLFLWPAPRTTNSAISRPAPLVPAVTAPAEPTTELTPTPTPTTTHRPRPAPPRTRRVVSPVVETTTPAASVSTEPTTTESSSTSPSASEPPASGSTTTSTTTKPKDD
ncbi:MAG: hypothetical protein JNM77_10505 [Pseudonocardia sp.]|nr:hypothetical protein [Pseudonocardia sp.]